MQFYNDKSCIAVGVSGEDDDEWEAGMDFPIPYLTYTIQSKYDNTYMTRIPTSSNPEMPHFTTTIEGINRYWTFELNSQWKLVIDNL